ncbi:MAG TPA: LptF/LptG family permease [Vicinamibacterales bacterium]|nr:LptF/LptG family permease [Vicinamibacterales bacterium]
MDRYVLSEFWKIFVVTALGFPILVIVIDLTDNLEKYLNKKVPRADIALSYLYWLPDSMFMILPAAVLFATVFSVGNFTRHSEITAAKASGISFYRMVLPIILGAAFATCLDLALGEVVPLTNSKRADLLGEARFRADSVRWNFAHAAEHGRVYKAAMLDRVKGEIRELQIERKGQGPEYPTYVITAREASWQPRGGWALETGAMHVVPDTLSDVAFSFERMVDRKLTERPADLMAKPRSPQEMRYNELTRFIVALERSGGDANVLRVERALKIAIPVTCLIIALFGAPLATSTQRGGAAFGVGISLATTVIFLMMIQLTKAVGGKGLIHPDVAAWIPNMIFAGVGLFLLARVRT